MSKKGYRQTPERKVLTLEHRAKIKASWEIPEIRIKHIIAMKQANSKPEVKSRRSVANIGEKNPMYGRKNPHTPEWRALMSEKMTGRHPGSESIIKHAALLRGRPQTPEHIAKRVAGRKGYKMSPETKAKIKATSIKIWANPKLRAKQSADKKGKPFSSERRAKSWDNPQWKEATLRRLREACNHKQTKIEKIVEVILNEILPNEYKYIGTHKETMINNCFPDFINVNSQKKVIEVFGDYWHSPKITGKSREQEEIDKVNNYRAVGFDCLILWGIDINKHPESVKKRIIAFHKARHKHTELQPNLL